MPAPDDLYPGTPDPAALQRRVLLAAVVTLALFLTAAYLISVLEVSDAWLLLAMALIYGLATRPLMAPVFAAIKLRRRLAYQAFLEQRQDGDQQ